MGHKYSDDFVSIAPGHVVVGYESLATRWFWNIDKVKEFLNFLVDSEKVVLNDELQLIYIIDHEKYITEKLVCA